MDNVTIMAFDCTDALNELKEFFGEIGKEEVKDPAIVVALRRVIDGARNDECFDDPRGKLIIEMLEMFLKPVTTENLLDMVTVEMQFAEMLKESATEETDD